MGLACCKPEEDENKLLEDEPFEEEAGIFTEFARFERELPFRKVFLRLFEA
jgi:hypothetical protein